jgi:putative transposase
MGKRHSPEQIVRKLHQAEARLAAGATVPEVARELGISEATFHRWRNHYGAMSTSEAKRLKELYRRRMLASRSFLPRRSWT